MSYYVKDSFDMPHNEGIKATVVRVDSVILAPNLFGGIDAKVFTGNSDEPSEVYPNVRISIEDPDLRKKLGLEKWSPSYPMPDDTVLSCLCSGELIEWYKVTYEYADQTNG